MAKATTVYHARAQGFWNTRHDLELETENGREALGTLKIGRRRFMVTDGDWQPVKGEVLLMRRDPGLLRSQFSLWTDRREWLGSSLRPNVVQREVELSTANKPLHFLAREGLGCGWSLYAPKSGQILKVETNPLSRKSRIEVYRRLDFPMVVFAYFLGVQLQLESLLPGPEPAKVKAAAAATAV